MKNYITLLGIFLIFATTEAQDLNTQKLDSLFDLVDQHHKMMGSVALIKNGEEIYTRSIGFADLEKEKKANKNTKYRIGSITKSFTATVILQLIDEGKLTLNTNLAEFYPDIVNASEITIQQLLNHHSGLFNFTSAEDYLSMNTQAISKQELLAIIKKNGKVFEPGEKGEYSNTNYLLLTFIAEDLEKDSFSNILEERIFKPLKLKNTEVGKKINPNKNEAFSYSRKMGTWKKEAETHMSVPLGAGNIISTPIDIAKFYSAVLEGKLLSAGSLLNMKIFEERFGLGLFQLPYNEHRAYGHTGGIDGFSSMAGYFPNEKMAFVLTANANSINLNDIALSILADYFEGNFEMPQYSKEIILSMETLTSYEGVYGSESFPLDISITNDEGNLIAQATGQSSFKLTPTSKNTFVFTPAGIKITFKNNQLSIEQGGGVHELNKK
ncbi:serine hydrolase domain-containing protein [Mesonia ostreae]|uniref:Serine hydrolase domain-containing protein n=1 Tax=Mesonia ostreae TaxID=861110 RepID=A0ABU2KEJ6_9FLAO|nr:serine hydrolase domain-containing protein [Mesonia ostreae]MDT0293136.1 serine hydrolase domain-containing protein [Mesonia ostreae]